MKGFTRRIKMAINNVLLILKKCLPKKYKDDSSSATKNNAFPQFFRQSLTALGPLLLAVVVGMTLGYSAVLLPQLQETAKHELDAIQINIEEASWIASLAVLPMAAGALIGGFFIQKYGRKKTHIIVCFPYFIGWLVMYFAFNLEMLLTGRFLTGLSSGILAPASGVYIGETSAPEYRGVLLGGIPLSVSIGLLVSHLLGTFLTWQTTALIISILPLISWILMTFTPESPAWLAQKGLTEKAQESFYWLRGPSDESKQELEQMLAKQKETDAMEDKTFKERMKGLLVPEFWKPMGILLVFFISTQWAGVNAVNFYSVTFMKRTLGDSVNEYLATFIIDCLRLASSVLACVLLRKIGRRPLALVGGVGTFIPLFILSGYFYFTNMFNINNNPNLAAVPITCLLTYIFFVTSGFVTLPWALLGELLPMSKKSTGSGIASFVAYMSIFSVVKTMPSMFQDLGTDGTFLVYGTMALLGTIFVFFCLPESKGKTLHEIEEHFKSTSVDNVVNKSSSDSRL